MLLLLLAGCQPVRLWLGGGLDAGPVDASGLDVMLASDGGEPMTDASVGRDVSIMDAGLGIDASPAAEGGAHTDASAALDASTDADSVQASTDAGEDAGGGGGHGGDGDDAGAFDSGTSCSDNLHNGDETDIDCGGPCPPCALAQMCQVEADCSPSAPGCDATRGGCTCNLETDACVASHCDDFRQDADETDVDCGGSCEGCGPTKGCELDMDCSRTVTGCDGPQGCYCDALTDTCVYGHCFDHKVSSGEPDVDCGFPDCLECVLGKYCYFNADCESNACDGISNTCVNNQCADHHRDGTESDTDCGGTSGCPKCPVGRKCTTNSDCLSGFCTGTTYKTCQ